MKIDKNAVAEIFLGVLAAGIILVVLGGLFNGWIASQGAAIHGKDASGKNFEEA